MFATHALGEELLARDAGLDRPKDSQIDRFRDMVETADQLTSVTRDLIDEFHAMHTTPNNLRVIASRLEPTGGRVTTLSQNYSVMSREMSDWFRAHVLRQTSNFATIKSTVNTSMFLQCMARVLKECDQKLTQERRSLGDIDVEAERLI